MPEVLLAAAWAMFFYGPDLGKLRKNGSRQLQHYRCGCCDETNLRTCEMLKAVGKGVAPDYLIR